MSLMRGFSLIEVILYIALIAVLLPILTYFLFSVLRLMAINITISSVNLQSTQALQLFNQIVRNADKIIFPLLGDSSSTLSLIIFKIGGATSSVTISSDLGRIKLAEGTSTIISSYLTNSGVGISGLLFSNASRGNTAGSVKTQFTAATSTYSKIFYGSASLRKH